MMNKVQEPNQLDRPVVELEDLDLGYKFVQCSSINCRKRLEEIIYPVRRQVKYVLYTRLGKARKTPYADVERALVAYNRIGFHNVKLETLNMPMELVIAASFSNRQKQLSFRYNAVSKELMFFVYWKNPNKPKSTRQVDTIEEAVALYNSI